MTTHRRVRTRLLASAVPMLLAGGTTLVTGAARADEDETVTRLAPVMVEARQWTEDVRRTPGTVDLLTPEDQAGPLANGLAGIARHTPNVLIEQSSVQTRVVMRGMTVANTALQDPLGFTVNDVALPHGAVQAPRLPDPGTMEILKGPQGSLYGRNTEAGLIRTGTADPDWQSGAEARAILGFEDGADGWSPAWTISGRVSGAIAPDKAAAALALRAEQARGPGLNLADGADDGASTDRLTVSGGLTLLPDDDTDISLKSVVERADLGKQRLRFLTGPYATPRHVTNYDAASWDDTVTAIQSLRIDHRAGPVDITAITGWTHYTRDFRMDLDGTPLPTLPTLSSHKDDTVSQELRIASPDDGARLRWLAGLYGYVSRTDLDFRIGTPRVARETSIDQTGIAGFGQAEYGLTQDLRVTLGARVERIDQSGRMRLTNSAGSSTFDADITDTTLLPKISLAWDVAPETMLHASYARGYLPGGYNYGNATGSDSLTYGAEHSWTAEAGVKTALFAGRVLADLTLFHTTSTDRQILDLEPGGVTTISNAAEARIYGAELALDGRIDEVWGWFATGGLQKAEATSYRTTVNRGGTLVPVDYSGNRLPMAAEATWSVGLRYDEGGPAGGDGWFGLIAANGSGPYYFDGANSLSQDAFALADAALGYRFGTIEVSLQANNIFDRNVYARAVGVPLGQLVEDGTGREVSLQVKASW
jgi:iron complex outermembrane receptor protein